MSTFGDIRSAVHSGKKENVRIALASYDGTLESISGYIPKDKMPLIWVGLNGEKTSAVEAYSDDWEYPLSAVIRFANRDEVIWRCEKPKMRMERALVSIKRDKIEKHWRPWAGRYDKENANKLVNRLFSMLELWLSGSVPYGELCRFREAVWMAINESMSNSRVWSNAAWFAALSLTVDTAYECAHYAFAAEREIAKKNGADVDDSQLFSEAKALIDNYLLGTK